MTLDLNDLAVETFPTADGDPSQWLMRLPPDTADTMDECCPDDLDRLSGYATCGYVDG